MSKERNKARGTFQIERHANFHGIAFIGGALVTGIPLVIAITYYFASR